ncbi:hypothetical protein FA95DRAFT_1557602 [Auriscalpium vulgare]|uniref:Uncharacterized protein n=1 Tax=Auriscalpium vulgare TaxID=40419 RepID=A0ACB8RY80_9AGAM|nr:hypothetical protein FA95DRAFT_1557602 [Auriscalpium vulgare]
MSLYHSPPSEMPLPLTVVVPSRSPSRDSVAEERCRSRSPSPMRYTIIIPPPPQPQADGTQDVEERGRSRSRSSRQYTRITIHPPPQTHVDGTQEVEERARSRSPSSMQYTRITILPHPQPHFDGTQEVEERGRSQSPSSMQYMRITIRAPPQPQVNETQEVEERGRSRSRSPMPQYRPPPFNRNSSPCRSPLLYEPSPFMYIPPGPMVDILTYCYKSQMAYAPAGQTYEDAINCAQDAFPDLKLVPNDRISFHVTGVDQLVRIPKMSWQTVMQDVRRYEVVHIVVEDVQAPPKYQGRRLGCHVSFSFRIRSGRKSSTGSSNSKSRPGGFWARLRGAL